MVRPWRSLHRVPGCSDIKLMASAEPSDTPAPLHAIKGDTVSILTRMAILIHPYLLRLGLPTGSLLRTILIRASFILIYWREVSKFQTLHISTYPSYLAYLPVSRRGAAGSRLVARETVESTVRSLRSERVAWYGRCRGLRFGTVLTLALDGSGVGAARRPSDSVLLYTPLGSPSIAAPSNLKGYMFSRGEPVDTDDIDEAITRNLWKNHRLLAPNLRILSHWFSLIITLVLVRTFCLKATLRTLCWRNNIVCVHVSCSTMQSTSPLSSASASSFRPQSIPCTSPLIFSVHCQSQSTLYALPHSHLSCKVDFLFLCDIVINFRTVYYNEDL